MATTFFRVVITTQIRENYGSHDWDGNGECPQYWKYKGGSEYQRNIGDANTVIELGQDGLQRIVAEMSEEVTHYSDSFEEYLIDWDLVLSDEETYEEQFKREMAEYDRCQTAIAG